jgi:hypothetical protein
MAGKARPQEAVWPFFFCRGEGREREREREGGRVGSKRREKGLKGKKG